MQSIIISAFQLVGAILSAFGGGLLNAQPPDSAGSTAYVAALSSAILSLILTSLVRQFGAFIKPLFWALLSFFCLFLFLVVASRYGSDKRERTIGIPTYKPTTWYIIGTQKTSFGKRVFQNSLKGAKPQSDPAIVIMGVSGTFPERIKSIYTLESIRASEDLLTREYIAVIVLVSLSLFFAAEGAKCPRDNKQNPESSTPEDNENSAEKLQVTDS